jgi:enterobacterial common antigen flippase
MNGKSKRDMDLKTDRSNGSYRQILRSTTILGGASVINIVLRILRTKFLAILLGPAGIGLWAIFNSIAEVAGTVAAMGIDTSGVKKVAEVAGGREQEKLARTIHALRRTLWCLGAGGMILVALLSPLISQFTFGNDEHSYEIMLLSIVIVCGTIMNGEITMIQGMRRVGDLAKVNIFGALWGTLLAVPIVYVWGQKGVVPSLIAVSAISLVSTWWYTRKIQVTRVRMAWAEVWREVKPVLILGAAVMGSIFVFRGTPYLVNVLITRQIGLEAVGLLQAATVLSSIYVGFIIDSMGKDYLPRLSAIANDDAACNKLVNEQFEIAILIAVPGIVATLTFAPLILQVFYSSDFISAFEILRWQIMGILLQVASWPIFSILLAKGYGKLFFATMAMSNALYVGLAVVGISYAGLNGAGMAFFGMWAFYAIIIYIIAKYLTGFTWSSANARVALVTFPAVGGVFVSGFLFNPFWSMIIGGTMVIAMAFYSIRTLLGIMGPGGLLPLLRSSKAHV